MSVRRTENQRDDCFAIPQEDVRQVSGVLRVHSEGPTWSPRLPVSSSVAQRVSCGWKLGNYLPWQSDNGNVWLRGKGLGGVEVGLVFDEWQVRNVELYSSTYCAQKITKNLLCPVRGSSLVRKRNEKNKTLDWLFWFEMRKTWRIFVAYRIDKMTWNQIVQLVRQRYLEPGTSEWQSELLFCHLTTRGQLRCFGFIW